MELRCHDAWVDLLTPQIAGFVAVGVFSGVLSGLLGVGGATVSTPGVRAFGATPIQAVASTIPAVLPSAIIGAWRAARAGLVDWKVAGTCGVAGSIAAVCGALVSDSINAHLLMVFTAVVLLSSGITVMRSGARGRVHEEPVVDLDLELANLVGDTRSEGALMVATAPSRIMANTWAIAAVGAAAGVIAGLLGVGGGVVMMPLFTGALRIPIKRAVPTSLVAVAIFSVPALLTHLMLGHIDWTIAMALVVGVMPGARIGAHFTRIASDVTVARLFGLFLVVLAVVYAASEFDAILALV